MKRSIIIAMIYVAVGSILAPMAEILDPDVPEFDLVSRIVSILVCPLALLAGMVRKIWDKLFY